MPPTPRHSTAHGDRCGKGVAVLDVHDMEIELMDRTAPGIRPPPFYAAPFTTRPPLSLNRTLFRIHNKPIALSVFNGVICVLTDREVAREWGNEST